MTLTASQIAKIRRALGSYESLFTDEALQIYADDAYSANPLTWIEGAISEAFYKIAMDHVDETDFKQGETSESRKIIYDRLWSAYLFWSNKAGYNSLPTFEMRQIPLQYMDWEID
jgi:hypothetical protein